jgi:hypothetical protein
VITFFISTMSPEPPKIAEDVGEEMQSELDDSMEDAYSSEGDSGSEHSSPNTDDEIAGKGITKSKKTLKRKRRATEPSRFGATLQFLLDTDAPSAQPLSLKPSVARKRNDEKLELKAKKVLQIEKKEKEDKGRVTDVIGGWGGESERALRKVAQRGGNVILFIYLLSLLKYRSRQTFQRYSAVTGCCVGCRRGNKGFERFWEAFASSTLNRKKCEGQG